MKKTATFIASLFLMTYLAGVAAFADGAYVPEGLPIATDTEFKTQDKDRALILSYIGANDLNILSVTRKSDTGKLEIVYNDRAAYDALTTYIASSPLDKNNIELIYNSPDRFGSEKDRSYAYDILSDYISMHNLNIQGIRQNSEGQVEITCNDNSAYNTLNKLIAEKSINPDAVFLTVNENGAGNEEVSEPFDPAVYEYTGFFDLYQDHTDTFRIGEDIDMDMDWPLKLCIISDGTEYVLDVDSIDSRPVDYMGFSFISGFSDCLSIDMSEADFSKEGYYNIYIYQKEGNQLDVTGKDGYKYKITLTDHTIVKRIHVTDKNYTASELKFVYTDVFSNNYYMHDGEEIIIYISNTDGTDLTLKAGDESIISVGQPTEHDVIKNSCTVKVSGLKAGTTTLAASAADGRTAVCTINVDNSSFCFASRKYTDFTGSIGAAAFTNTENKPVKFVSSDDSVVSIVKSSGNEVNFKLLSEGIAKITAIANDGETAEFTVVVLGEQTTTTVMTEETTETTTDAAQDENTADPNENDPTSYFLYGDINADGRIAADDAAVILQKTLIGSFRLPIENKTNDWFRYADVSGDGQIEADDAAVILQKTLTNSYKMPVEVNK